MKKIESIQEVQRISLSLLDSFDQFCKKHQLQYFLAWGTLLGAIRHKGFIPWDDDIDLMMLREDYDRLVELNIEQPEEGVRFYSYKQKGDYDNVNCRFSDEHTVVDLSRIENPVNQGIWLTVFPVDAIPDNESERKSFLKSIHWRYKLVLALSMKDEYLDVKTPLEKYPAKALKRVLGMNVRKKIYNTIHAIMRKYVNENTKDVGILSIGTGKRTHFSRTCFSETMMAEFEGKEYPIPTGYDEILRNTYGNYMELPPIEQRVPKHDFEAYYK